MLIPNHPDDEVLAAYAADEADAVADPALTDHLAACERCGEVIADVRALRASLADLPDVRPHRPLQLLPPVDEPVRSDGLVTWVRRLFAPVMAAGATLALVGAVGTASPAALESVSMDFGAGEAQERTADSAAQPSAAGEAPAEAGADDNEIMTLATPGAEAAGDEEASADPFANALPAERSPWPMVLFTGVALALGALLLRWIVVPRAG
jgi:hypothetical protein